MNKKNKKGLSILEISISIIILVMVFGMAMPFYSKYIGKMKYVTAVREIISGIKIARSIAMTSAAQNGCIIDIANEIIYIPEDPKVEEGLFEFSADSSPYLEHPLTDNDKSWTVDRFKGYGLLILTGSMKNQLALILSNSSKQLIATGIAGNPIDQYEIIPMLKKQFINSVDIVSITPRNYIVFQQDGSIRDELGNYIDYTIVVGSKGITPPLSNTIEIKGATGAVYKQ